MADFILASGSKDRLNLLVNNLNCKPKQITPADIDETPLKKEKPTAYVVRMSNTKALTIKEKFKNDNILAADSIVVVNNKIIQKPKDIEELKYFLSLYSGKNVKCYTSVTFIKKNGDLINKLVLSKVKFKVFNNRDINDLLREENISLNTAGGIKIEGFCQALIKKIDGSYSNIRGLPLYEVRNILISAGIKM